MEIIQKTEDIKIFYKAVVDSSELNTKNLLGIIAPMNIKLENPFKLIGLI